MVGVHKGSTCLLPSRNDVIISSECASDWPLDPLARLDIPTARSMLNLGHIDVGVKETNTPNVWKLDDREDNTRDHDALSRILELISRSSARQEEAKRAVVVFLFQ